MILNKEGLDSKIRSIGYSLGCYDDSINALLQESIEQIIDALTGDDTSIFFEENSTLKVVEVMYVNQEVDLYLYDAVSYFEKYGNLEEALDVGTINDEQYREIKEAVEWQGGINLINDENRIKIMIDMGAIRMETVISRKSLDSLMMKQLSIFLVLLMMYSIILKLIIFSNYHMLKSLNMLKKMDFMIKHI